MQNWFEIFYWLRYSEFRDSKVIFELKFPNFAIFRNFLDYQTGPLRPLVFMSAVKQIFGHVTIPIHIRFRTFLTSGSNSVRWVRFALWSSPRLMTCPYSPIKRICTKNVKIFLWFLNTVLNTVRAFVYLIRV